MQSGSRDHNKSMRICKRLASRGSLSAALAFVSRSLYTFACSLFSRAGLRRGLILREPIPDVGGGQMDRSELPSGGYDFRGQVRSD